MVIFTKKLGQLKQVNIHVIFSKVLFFSGQEKNLEIHQKLRNRLKLKNFKMRQDPVLMVLEILEIH
jgi:hypothetical protein